jgi:hypothetical protein
MLKVLVSHYSNYGTKNKTVTLAIVRWKESVALNLKPHSSNTNKMNPHHGQRLQPNGTQYIYRLINLHLVVETLSSPNCKLIFMRATVKDNGTMEPYRSVQWPTSYIEEKAVIRKHYMNDVKIPTQPKDNYNVQNITTY